MANQQYVYTHLITTEGYRPYIYSYNGILFAPMTIYGTKATEDKVELFISTNNGSTWVQDEGLPAYDTPLTDVKCIMVGSKLYLFAHGESEAGVDTILFIRKTYDEEDDKMYWDTEWHRLFSASPFNCRITDLAVDAENSFIHIMYDIDTIDGYYTVRYGLFSVNNDVLEYNFAISDNAVNQNNAHLAMMKNYKVAVVWDEEDSNGTKQVWCAKYDLLANSWKFKKQITTSQYTNYHISLAIDSEDTIHVTWLYTSDNYKTDFIKYTTIVGDEVKPIITIDKEAQSSQYPIMLCNEEDKLFILYNSSSQEVNYYVKYLSDTEWSKIDFLQKNKWLWTNGICNESNIYTIVDSVTNSGNMGMHFVVIDTTMAVGSTPIRDLQITSLNHLYITLTWSYIKYAQQIAIQYLQEDIWSTAKIANEDGSNVLTATSNTTEVINLPDGKYKFRIKLTTIYKTFSYLYLPEVYELTNQEAEKTNIVLNWQPIKNVIAQEVEYSKETWIVAAYIDTANTVNTASIALSNIVDEDTDVPQFRLLVTGGSYEGISNIVQPLKIAYDDSDEAFLYHPFLLDRHDIAVTWLGIDADTIYLQQSLDGNEWFNLDNIDTNTTSVHVPNEDVYRYRLKFIKNEEILYSNVVSIVTDLTATEISYDSIALHWTSINPNEEVQFQYAVKDKTLKYCYDYEVMWKTISLPINNSSAILNSLNYNTEYVVRLKFPTRRTGKYSNIIDVTTARKPISDLQVVKHTDTSLTLAYSINETVTDANIYICDFAKDITNTFKLFDCDYTVNSNTDSVYHVSVTIPAKQGIRYQLAVEPLEGNYGNLSNIIEYKIAGITPQNLHVVSTTAHSITVGWDELSDINNDNCSTSVVLFYSYNNGVTWNNIVVDSINNNQYTLEEVYQNTEYQLKLWCDYGYHHGMSEIINGITQEDIYPPIIGSRLPNERSCVLINNVIYILDKSVLYSYNVTTKEQQVVHDFQLSDVINSTMAVDKNGCLHIVCAKNYQILYYTNCKNKTTEYKLTEPIVIYDNVYVNKCINPHMKIADNNMMYLVWETDYGSYSEVCFVQYKNGEPIIEVQRMIKNEGYNHMPKIALMEDGWFVTALYQEKYLTVIRSILNNDYSVASTYLQYSMVSDIIELENPYSTDIFNDYDIATDNINTLRIFYNSYNEGISSTYATYSLTSFKNTDKYKFEVQNVYTALQDIHMHVNNEFIMVGKSDNRVTSARFVGTRFSNPMIIDGDIDDNVLVSCCDINNLYIIGTLAGKWEVITKSIQEIREENKYVEGLWIDNKFTLQNDKEDYLINIWTNGDINVYPSLYLKCNNITKNITPLDEYGDNLLQTIIVNNLSYITLNDTNKATYADYINDNTKVLIKIDYNDTETLIIDVTNMMYYAWDNTTIINSASKK